MGLAFRWAKKRPRSESRINTDHSRIALLFVLSRDVVRQSSAMRMVIRTCSGPHDLYSACCWRRGSKSARIQWRALSIIAALCAVQLASSAPRSLPSLLQKGCFIASRFSAHRLLCEQYLECRTTRVQGNIIICGERSAHSPRSLLTLSMSAPMKMPPSSLG